MGAIGSTGCRGWSADINIDRKLIPPPTVTVGRHGQTTRLACQVCLMPVFGVVVPALEVGGYTSSQSHLVTKTPRTKVSECEALKSVIQYIS